MAYWFMSDLVLEQRDRAYDVTTFNWNQRNDVNTQDLEKMTQREEIEKQTCLCQLSLCHSLSFSLQLTLLLK